MSHDVRDEDIVSPRLRAQLLEKRLREEDRNPHIRTPINRHAHDDDWRRIKDTQSPAPKNR